MKKIVILDGKTLGNVAYDKLNEFGNVVYYDETNKEEVADRIKDAHIVLTNKVVLEKDVLEQADNLELICEMATGYNNIDIKTAAARNIAVTNVAGYSTVTVAQHTFAMLLSLYNKISFYDEYVKSGKYSDSGVFTNVEETYHDIEGKVWGIIGLGNIGRRTAKIAESFGAKVVYYSTSGNHVDEYYKRVDFEELIEKSDIISIHAPLNERTNNLIDYAALMKMKKEAVIINVGRGPIVNNEDLAKALDEGIIGGAALDVFDTEPVDKNNPIMSVKNKNKIILTPHIAWASEEARNRLFNDLIENIRAYNKGETRNRVEK